MAANDELPPDVTEIDIAELDADEGKPAERLSLARLGAVGLIAAAIVGAGALSLREVSSSERPMARSWNVPYVDVTLTPRYEFQDPELNPSRDIALAFVVAHPDEPCTPSWGGAYTLDEAASDLELDRRITQLRAAGGDVMISFGGQANHELAYACDDVEQLTAAYREVVERYDAAIIDLDIENADIADVPSIERRAQAITTVQAERAADGHELAVWITLPAATYGLTEDGVALVSATLGGGVELTGVNAMTMNFSDASAPTSDMLAATKSSLEAMARQIAGVYADHGVDLDDSETWEKVGATSMIGQNDVPGEIFTLDDAKGLAEFAVARGVGRVSTWSLNRDQPCAGGFANVAVLSNTCSGVEQLPLDFAAVFVALPGRAAALPQTDSVTVPDRVVAVDDSTTSPYPIWRPDAHYPEGYKVVRSGLVYQAKWYTDGHDPSSAVPNPWDTPWSLVGPVGPDDVPFAPTTMAPGTHPEWDPEPAYSTGDVVLFQGLPYEARWNNKNDPPPTMFPVGPDSAWMPLFSVPGEPGAP